VPEHGGLMTITDLEKCIELLDKAAYEEVEMSDIGTFSQIIDTKYILIRILEKK
jgi:hypothetical protein